MICHQPETSEYINTLYWQITQQMERKQKSIYSM